MSRRHSHGGVHRRRRGSGTVGASSWAGVVLRATPAQAHPRVSNGVALHLVDGHLSGVALDELDETAALARGDLDIGDFTEALEERTELILGNVAGETANENGGVVGVSELVHGLGSTVEAHRGSTHRGVHASRTGHTHGTRHNTGALVLGGGGRNAHGTVTAVNTLHLAQGTLLVVLIRETNETVATGHAADGVGHDLGRLAGGETALEERNKNVFVDLRAEITNEDRVFGTTVVTASTQVNSSAPEWRDLDRLDKRKSTLSNLPSVSQTTASGPVELENPVGVGHGGTVQGQSLGSRSRGGEVNEAVASVAPTTNIRIVFNPSEIF